MANDIFKELGKVYDGGTLKDCCITDELAIISHYGVKHQLKKLIEEVYELIEAALIHECGAGYSDEQAVAHIAEELADCHVILEQLRQHYKVDADELKKNYDMKIARQLARMVNERREHENQ